jgi:HEAT repeat protein
MIGEPAGDIARGLVNALEHDRSEEVRAAAATALGSLPLRDDDRARMALERALEDTAPLVRLEAATALSGRESHTRQVVQVLAALVLLEAFPGRWEAARSLGAMGSRAVGGVGALRSALSSLDRSLRCDAVTALGLIGPAARDALPALRELLRYATLEELRAPIADAIAAIEAESVPQGRED